ncbi:hypothetical protein CARUB_v10024664mg [Capsella rubella]|uniref:Uncharacterized protein n=1 Tax=Capsella rubella TaxID=81985 RepID=R0HSW4_9BRAS|nr:hypothetical protein CARUB_v10024664mg [Capsella rubella]
MTTKQSIICHINNMKLPDGSRVFRYTIVEELASFGARIHVCDISETLLNQSLSEWEKKGFQVSGSVCDVSSRPERENLMQTVSSLFDGKLNILVNNVGVLRGKPTTECVEEDFSFHMSINVEAAFHFSQLSHPLLKASGNGSIVFISSVAGIVSLDGASIYSLTKASYITGQTICVDGGFTVNGFSYQQQA